MSLSKRLNGVLGGQESISPPPSPEVKFTAQSQSCPPIRTCSGRSIHTELYFSCPMRSASR
jgi:hypothetical protein